METKVDEIILEAKEAASATGSEKFTWDLCMVVVLGDPNKEVEIEVGGKRAKRLRRIREKMEGGKRSDVKKAIQSKSGEANQALLSENSVSDEPGKTLNMETLTVKQSEAKLFKRSTQNYLRSLKRAGLHCFYYETETNRVPFYPACMKKPDTTHKMAIIMVGADEERLQIEADRQDYQLRLDRDACIEHAMTNPDDHMYLAERSLSNEGIYASLDIALFDNLYGKYDTAEELQHLYVRYGSEEGPHHQDSFFRTVDRIKLTRDIMECEGKYGGAGLKFSEMFADKSQSLEAVFPLHQKARMEILSAKWGSTANAFKMPLAQIREYFGESVALYFAFLAFLTIRFVTPSVFGLSLYIYNYATSTEGNFTNTENEPGAVGALVFVGAISIWMTILSEHWTQEQSRLEYLWGMHKTEELEQLRVEFEGEMRLSVTNGQWHEVLPMRESCKRRCLSYSTVFALVCTLLSIVTSTFVLKSTLVDWDPTYGSYIASTINSVLITIMNYIYGKVAPRLNEYEQHATQSAHDNAYIWKSFVFRFINSYYSLFYIAFVQRFNLYNGGAPCPDEDPYCMDALNTSILTIFGTQIIINNFLEWFWPWLHARNAADQNKASGRVLSEPEKQYQLKALDSTMADFDELIVVFGYATMFAVACPIAPLLALFSALIESRMDSTKYIKEMRRPFPRPTNNIGTWQDIMSIMGVLAVLINLTIVFFVSRAGSVLFNNDTDKFLAFVFLEHAFLALKFILAYVMPDKKTWFEKHAKRQAHVVGILIEGNEEEADADVPLPAPVKGQQLDKGDPALISSHLSAPQPITRLNGKNLLSGVFLGPDVLSQTECRSEAEAHSVASQARREKIKQEAQKRRRERKERRGGHGHGHGGHGHGHGHGHGPGLESHDEPAAFNLPDRNFPENNPLTQHALELLDDEQGDHGMVPSDSARSMSIN
jgi:hypothetical protein